MILKSCGFGVGPESTGYDMGGLVYISANSEILLKKNEKNKIINNIIISKVALSWVHILTVTSSTFNYELPLIKHIW